MLLGCVAIAFQTAKRSIKDVLLEKMLIFYGNVI